MKKFFIILSLSLVLLSGVIYNNASQNEHIKSEILLASAGLKENRVLLEQIDKNMLTIFKNIQKKKLPTDKELNNLANTIETLRSWGGDLTNKSKVVLEQLVVVLKAKSKNRVEVLDKLEEISKDSVHLVS